MGPLKIISDYIYKARSRIYGIFVFWIIILHLPIIFTSIFVDQNLIFKKTNLLKNEYIKTKFFDYAEWWQWILYILITLLIAGLLTWLMIWVLPKTLIAKAYNRELDDQYEREFKKITKDKELESKRQSLAETQLETASKTEKVVKKQEDIEQSERKQWQKDFEEFKKDPAFNSFIHIIKAIYENKGRLKVTQYNDGSGAVLSRIPAGTLAMVDGLGLVNINNENETMVLTDKGRYFVSQYPLGK